MMSDDQCSQHPDEAGPQPPTTEPAPTSHADGLAATEDTIIPAGITGGPPASDSQAVKELPARTNMLNFDPQGDTQIEISSDEEQPSDHVRNVIAMRTDAALPHDGSGSKPVSQGIDAVHDNTPTSSTQENNMMAKADEGPNTDQVPMRDEGLSGIMKATTVSARIFFPQWSGGCRLPPPIQSLPSDGIAPVQDLGQKTPTTPGDSHGTAPEKDSTDHNVHTPPAADSEAATSGDHTIKLPDPIPPVHYAALMTAQAPAKEAIGEQEPQSKKQKTHITLCSAQDTQDSHSFEISSVHPQLVWSTANYHMHPKPHQSPHHMGCVR